MQALGKVEMHIRQSSILSQLLEDKQNDMDINYEKYLQQGYCSEDVAIGAELVELYMMLQKYAEESGSNL